MGMSKNYSLKSPFCGKIRARSNTCFIGPLRVHMPNGVSIGLAVTNRRTRGGGSNLKVGEHMASAEREPIRGSGGGATSGVQGQSPW